MPMKRRLRGRSAMREERKSHRCLKSRGGWRWEQRSRKKAAESETWNYAEPGEKTPEEAYMEKSSEKKMYSQKNLLRSMRTSCAF